MLELDKESITMQVGETETLEIVKFSPARSDYTIRFVVQDPNIVKIEDGKIIALRQGETNVIVVVDDIMAGYCPVTVSGVYDEKNDIYLVCGGGYIKNGISYPLPFYAVCIDIQGEDIYMGGLETSRIEEGTTKAAYWKNGEKIRLSENGVVTGIAVAGDDVYVVGREMYSQFSGIAAVWKNGAATLLAPTEHYSSYANAVAVKNDDVYVVGQCYYMQDNFREDVAVYWKNGAMTPLSMKKSYAYDVTVSGEDVYVCGAEIVNEISVAKYWKNGVPYTLSDGTKNSAAKSIAVEGDDVYVVGYEDIRPDFDVPVYWKNGEKQILAEEMTHGYRAYIAVSQGDVYIYVPLFYVEDLCLKNNQPFHFAGPSSVARALKVVAK